MLTLISQVIKNIKNVTGCCKAGAAGWAGWAMAHPILRPGIYFFDLSLHRDIEHRGNIERSAQSGSTLALVLVIGS